MTPATFDLCVLGVVLLFTVAGGFSGGLRQLVQLATVVLGWLAARHLALPAAALVWSGRPLPWQRTLAAAVCFAVVAGVTGLAGRALASRLHGPSGRPGPADRGLGALLGGLKGALVAWLVLSLLARLGPIALGSFHLDVRRSDFGSLAARHDLLGAVVPDQARGLDLLLAAARDPATRERVIQKDPGLKKLLDDPRVKALLERLARPPAEGARPEPGLLEEPDVKALVERLERQ
jgi:membrane protein required for colicin V production